MGRQGRPANPVQIPDAADDARFGLFYCMYMGIALRLRVPSSKTWHHVSILGELQVQALPLFPYKELKSTTNTSVNTSLATPTPRVKVQP
jgi:hypothetical protein